VVTSVLRIIPRISIHFGGSDDYFAVGAIRIETSNSDRMIQT